MLGAGEPPGTGGAGSQLGREEGQSHAATRVAQLVRFPFLSPSLPFQEAGPPGAGAGGSP